jgi:hypothetical protein
MAQDLREIPTIYQYEIWACNHPDINYPDRIYAGPFKTMGEIDSFWLKGKPSDAGYKAYFVKSIMIQSHWIGCMDI